MRYWFIVLSLLVGFGTANAQPYSKQPLGDAVNIKDFGAVGDNSHDDTANIQAAIDYAFTNGLTAVYCPAGYYKTTSTIYLDPSGNLRSNLSDPGNSAFSSSFFGDPAAGGANYMGCKIYTTFNDSIAFLVGPGQGMRVSDISVIGPATAHRANQSSSGVGIGLSGGNAGSSGNLIENTYVANFYSLYKTDANGACCLSDSNTFRKVSGDNGYYGLQIVGTQSYINDVIEPRFTTTIGIDSEVSKAVSVFGGNISSGGLSASFGLSGVSSFSKVTNGNGFDYSFTATVASPDIYIPNIYSAYTIVTAHFGVVPLTMTGWNSGTNVGTFKIRPPWVFANYGTMDLTTGTDIQAEVAAATTLYAAERIIVAQGMGISLDGVHVEDPGACSSLFIAKASSAGAATNDAKNMFFNYGTSNPAGTAALHCQQTFPFVGFDQGGAGSITLQGGVYASGTKPLLFEVDSAVSKLIVSNISDMLVNINVYDYGGYAYSQLGGYGQFSTVGRGAGLWDSGTYFLPPALSGGYRVWVTNGELTSPFCGYEPCPWTTPNLTPVAFASVCPSASGGGSYGAAYTCGAMGTLAANPPIACRTTFKSTDWNTGAIAAGIFKRSASCPGYSWGQNLTDAKVGGTVTWSYKGQSNVLYMDALSLTFMFPGLTISIDNGGGAVKYTVTGVQPDLGYVTVMNATSDAGGPLVGTKTTVYSCSSSCTIVQQSYAWTAY